MNKKILIVDDSDEIVEILSDMICDEFQSVEVMTASNGKEAVVILMENDIDVVLTDLVMPQMDGIELCQEIRDMNLHVPIIVITGQSTDESIVNAIKLGVIEYLYKPMEMSKVVNVVRVALDKSKMIKKCTTEFRKKKFDVIMDTDKVRKTTESSYLLKNIAESKEELANLRDRFVKEVKYLSKCCKLSESLFRASGSTDSFLENSLRFFTIIKELGEISERSELVSISRMAMKFIKASIFRPLLLSIKYAESLMEIIESTYECCQQGIDDIDHEQLEKIQQDIENVYFDLSKELYESNFLE